MFEFLPGSDAAQVKPAKQESWVAATNRQAAEKAAAQKRKEDTTVWDGIGAVQVKGGIGFIDRAIQDLEYEPAPGYVIPQEARKRWESLGIRPEQWPLFEKAVSDDHLQLLEGLAFQNQMADDDLAQFGLGANIALGFTDPVATGADLLTGGLGYAAKAGRVANAVRSGLQATALSVAMDGATSQYDPEKTGEDMAINAGLSFAFAGALGARKGALVEAGDDAVNPEVVERLARSNLVHDENLSAAKVHGLADDPTPGLSPLRPETTGEQAFTDRALTNAAIQPAFSKVRRDLAARMGTAKSPLVREAGRVLFRDGVGYTDRNLAVEESTTEFSKRHMATLETEYRAGLNAAWSDFAESKGLGAARRQWAFKERAEFYEEVGRAVRGAEDVSPQAKAAAGSIAKTMSRALELARESGLEGFDNIANNPNYLPRYWSAKGFQKMFGELGLEEDQVVEGVIIPAMRKQWEEMLPARGESKIAEIEGHYRGASDQARMARELEAEHRANFGEVQQRLRDAEARLAALGDTADGKAIRAAERGVRNAEKELQRAERTAEGSRAKLADALKLEDESKSALNQARKVTEMDAIEEDTLRAVAKAYLKRAQKNFEGDGMALSQRPLDLGDVDEIARLLADAGVSPAEAAGVVGRLKAKADDAGKLDRAKHRIDLDENFSTTLRNATGEEVTVRMSDFFDNDVESVMARYVREITGWSALASKAGIKSRGELERFKNQLLVDAKKAGDNVQNTERLLDIGLKATFGRSTERDAGTAGSKFARFVRQYNFARVMNQVGFSLFAELGPTIAHGGLRNFVSSAAHVTDLIQRGADGKLTSKEARLMEELFAPGTDWMRNPPLMRLEDDAIVAPAFDGPVGRALENGVNYAAHVTSIMSGMAPMNTVLQRIAGRATMLRMLDLANAKELKPAMVARLRTWGLGEKDQEALFAALKGVRKIEDIPVDQMPFALREKMAAFLSRVTRHQVLEGEASDSVELMHSWHGKLLTQFRSFMFSSYTRHFLNSIHHYDDWRTYAMVSLSTAAAGVGWAARTYLNTIGDEEARREQLTEENFYKNAVAQSSWSTFAPMVTDMVWTDMLRNDPVFRYNRSTGLDNGIKGIPAVDLALKLYGSGGMVGAALQDDQVVTEKMVSDFYKTWLFQNMTGVRNLAREAMEPLPDKQLPQDAEEGEGTPLFP